MRRIPGTMATQHPDNAGAPYWDPGEQPFISVHQEIAEAVHCFQDLGVSEYMWDWEGKHADAAVIDRLLSEHHDYFSKHQLGRDKFLTFRLPNIWEEKGYNLLQAMTVILSGEDFTRDLKLHDRPLFEVILPMTENADQLMHMHTLFQKLARFKSTDFTTGHADNTDHIELIPLVESIESQHGVGDLLTEYVALHKLNFGRRPQYIRAFLACSDPAITSGFLATVLANKIALSRLYEFADQTGIPVYPIAGPGSLRFRGGLSPESIDRFLKEFPGVRTVTVQSAFRYDYPKDAVKAAIKRLETELPKTSPNTITASRQKQLIAISQKSARLYKATLHGVVPDLQPFFKATPRRRDRRQHIGLLAYARSSGVHALPRAITFTSGFYSIGVPPEFIGLGRTLQHLTAAELQLLHDSYPSLTSDLQAAGAYLNRHNLEILAKKNRNWKQVEADIGAAEAVLGVSFGPHTKDHLKHHVFSSKALHTSDKDELAMLIDKMAHLRKSLG